jgi:hypothetical protein
VGVKQPLSGPAYLCLLSRKSRFLVSEPTYPSFL